MIARLPMLLGSLPVNLMRLVSLLERMPIWGLLLL